MGSEYALIYMNTPESAEIYPDMGKYVNIVNMAEYAWNIRFVNQQAF